MNDNGAHGEIRYYGLKIEKYELHDDGSLTIPNIKIMASGTWHASNAYNPTRYGESVLEKYADSWSDNSLWSTHDQTRSITRKVGEVRNPRYQDKACMADLFLHAKTQESRDSITLITNNQIDSISAEIAIYNKTYCPKLEVDNAITIDFVGAALVSEGACEVCKLHSKNTENDIMTEELVTKLAEVEQKLAEITEKFESLEIPEAVDVTPVQEELAASKETIVALNTTIESLTERIVKIEAEPVVEITKNSVGTKEVYNPFE